MARQVLRTQAATPEKSEPRETRVHVIQLPEERKDKLMELRNQSGQTWAEWLEHGLAMLRLETRNEAESLMMTVPPAKSTDQRMSIRVYEDDVKSAQAMADRCQVPLRNVLLMALSLRMLWLPLGVSEGGADEADCSD